MKAIVAVLVLMGVVFSALTPTIPFPSSMAAGSTYISEYNDDINTPYFVTIMTDLMCDEARILLNAQNCDCNNSTINCTGYALPMRFNLTTVHNLKPMNYSINITAYGTRTVADAVPSARSYSSNGGGSVGSAYYPTVPSPPAQPAPVPEAVPEVKPPETVPEAVPPVTAPPVVENPIIPEPKPVDVVEAPIAATLTGTIPEELKWAGGALIVGIVGILGYLTLFKPSPPPKEPVKV